MHTALKIFPIFAWLNGLFWNLKLSVLAIMQNITWEPILLKEQHVAISLLKLCSFLYIWNIHMVWLQQCGFFPHISSHVFLLAIFACKSNYDGREGFISLARIKIIVHKIIRDISEEGLECCSSRVCYKAHDKKEWLSCCQ